MAHRKIGALRNTLIISLEDNVLPQLVSCVPMILPNEIIKRYELNAGATTMEVLMSEPFCSFSMVRGENKITAGLHNEDAKTVRAFNYQGDRKMLKAMVVEVTEALKNGERPYEVPLKGLKPE